jgi:cytidylate kinase
MALKIYQVAIDGPSGAGKSTVAKRLAEELGIDYIDTGAMYRAIAYKIIKGNIDIENEDSLRSMLDNTSVDFVKGDILLEENIISSKIRTPEVTMMASRCSAIPMVREKLVSLQRNMGLVKSVIMDGRDIGTNVFKDASFKYFITASVDERADRRFKEMVLKDKDIKFEDVKRDIEKRDLNDSTRAINPLTKADDAVEIDTTNMGIEEVTEYILKDIKEKLCQR